MSKKEEKRCIRCNQLADEKDQYCINCGAPLINRCIDQKAKGYGCGFVNRADAAYCAKCGMQTTFNLHGLI